MRFDKLFFMQSIISFVFMAIGIILIFYNADSTKFAIGVSMISSMVGYWLPNPNRKQFGHDEDDDEYDEESRGPKRSCFSCCPQDDEDEEYGVREVGTYDSVKHIDSLIYELTKPNDVTKTIPENNNDIVIENINAYTPDNSDSDTYSDITSLSDSTYIVVDLNTENTNEQINESTNEPTNESTNGPTNEQISEQITETTNEFINEQTNEQISESTNEQISEPIEELVSESIKEPVKNTKSVFGDFFDHFTV